MRLHQIIIILACINMSFTSVAISEQKVSDSTFRTELYRVRQNFLSALLKKDSERANNLQNMYFENRRLNWQFFAEQDSIYHKCQQALQHTTNPEEIRAYSEKISIARLFVWQTVYEDAAKMGLSRDEIISILAADPNRDKLLKLKKLKEDGLITEQEYEAKRKAIISGL